MQGTPRTVRPTAYLAVADLVSLLLEQRRRRRREAGVSEELAAALLKIAGGVWDRFRFTPDRDDFCQDAFLHLLTGPLRKADPARNLFAYFTTCVVRFGMKQRERQTADRRRFETYANEVLECGKPIPGRELGT